eukprot:jgi/Picsp_1/4431/NSC_06653-R1_condensin complex subunit 3
MGREKSKNSSLLSIPVLLNEAQKTYSHGHLRYATLLWETLDGGSSLEESLHQLCICLKWIVSLAECAEGTDVVRQRNKDQRNIYQDRLLKFFGVVASQATSPKRMECVEVLIGFLLTWCQSKEYATRWRSCQILGSLVNNVPEDMSDAVAEQVEEVTLLLLEDGKPTVRAAAVRALTRFPQPGEDGDFKGCNVVRALLKVLQHENSKEVRKAILSAIPSSPVTFKALVERTRDESDDVRRMAYSMLAEKALVTDVEMADLPTLLSRGILDRSPGVSQEAKKLVVSWFDGCEGEPLALLQQIDASRNVESAELAVKALLSTERVDPCQVATMAAENGLGLRADHGKGGASLMSPEEALFWRVVCEYLASEASSHGLAAANTGGANATIEAAVAGDRMDAFEALMPDSNADLANIIRLHRPDSKACSQLVLLAARCCDFTDASGRKCIGQVIQEMLVSDSLDDDTLESVFELIRKLYSSDEAMSEAAFDAIDQLLSSCNLYPIDSQKTHECDSMQLLRCLRVINGFLSLLKSLSHSSLGKMELTWDAIQMHMLTPAVSSADLTVRKHACIGIGLYSMLESDVAKCAKLTKSLFNTLISMEEADIVQEALVQALGDACLLRGPKSIDAMVGQNELAAQDDEETPTIADVLLHFVQEWQDSDRHEENALVGTAAIEALVRLAAVNELRSTVDQEQGTTTAFEDGEMLRVLVKLFIMCFSPCSEASPKARQCLMVFFQRYATMSVTCQQYLATALLPAARSAAAEDVAARRKTISAGAIAPQVIKFATQLLQLPVLNKNGEQEALGHEPLAELVMGEILKCIRTKNVPKQYMSALCKVPGALPMYDAGEETRDIMVRIQVYAAHASEVLADATMRKEMQAIYEQYSLPDAVSPALGEEEVATMLDGVKSHVEAFCAGFPEPFKQEDAYDDSDIDDSDEESVHSSFARIPARKLPARVTRTASNMTELSDDEADAALGVFPPIKEDPDTNCSDEEEERENSHQPPASRKTRRRASTDSVNALRDALQQARIA